MNEDQYFKVGDVITSQRFIYGERTIAGPQVIFVGLKSPESKYGRPMTDGEKTQFVLKNKRMPTFSEQTIMFDIGVPDLTRASAKFVVTECVWEEGSHSGNTIMPGSWKYFAKRLDGYGKWDPKGEEIIFVTEYNSSLNIDPKEIKVVGHMTKHVSFS